MHSRSANPCGEERGGRLVRRCCWDPTRASDVLTRSGVSPLERRMPSLESVSRTGGGTEMGESPMEATRAMRGASWTAESWVDTRAREGWVSPTEPAGEERKGADVRSPELSGP